MNLTDYHLRRALVRCPWRLWARAEGGQAQSRVVVGAHDVRREWRELVRSIDATSQERRLPSDVTTWIAHRVTVADVELWLRPVVDDGAFRWQREVIAAHIAEAAHATMAPRRAVVA